MQLIIISLVWLAGFIISFMMQRTEIASEKQPYTFGDRLLIIAMSLLSWLWVIVILVTAWVSMIKKTGFWNEPINPAAEPKEAGAKTVTN